jgi:hypothetical protein
MYRPRKRDAKVGVLGVRSLGFGLMIIRRCCLGAYRGEKLITGLGEFN